MSRAPFPGPRILALAVALLGAVPAWAALPVTLTPAKPAAWWNTGETVEFDAAPGIDPRVKALTGEIADSAGRKVGQVRVDRDALAAKGWRWTPEAPGYYEIAFSADLGGEAIPLSQSYGMKAPNGQTASFSRAVYSVAVVAPVSAAKPPGQFGFHYHLNPDLIPLAKLVGFDFAFIHSIPWGGEMTNLSRAIQPARDQWNWEAFDQDVKALSDAGFEIGAQFLYTPAWASPHPEKEGTINICVRESASYAPSDMSDFTRFVDQTVRRYGDRIRIWEIWNEPNIAGGSCYWTDTSENYVALLRAGYQAIKAAQPQSEVWLGGISDRKSYETFYDQILQGGAAGSYDRLSVHGSWPDIDNFRAVESRNNASHPPAVASEWHAILMGNMNPGNATEPALGMRMMGDLLHQLKQGVERTVFFEMVDVVDPEVLNFALQNKWFVHSSGLFRQRPRREPRLPAVIMANFLRVTGGSAKFVKEVAVPDGGYGEQLATANGDVAVFWNPLAPLAGQAVAAYASPSSAVLDWEGKAVVLDGGAPLEAGKVYYLLSPALSALQAAAPVDRLKSRPDVPRAAERPASVAASYRKGPLFDQAGRLLDGNAPWITRDWKRVALKELPGGEAFSARAAIGESAEGLDVAVEVRDAAHVQNEAPPALWAGDSLQVGIDCESTGAPGGNAEFVAALAPKGPQVWKLAAAPLRGDLPTRWSPTGGPARYVGSWIDREGTTTAYHLRIPWSELYPLAGDGTAPLRLSLLVNDNDGAGRAGWVEWGGGIGKDKDPSLYGTLAPAAQPGK